MTDPIVDFESDAETSSETTSKISSNYSDSDYDSNITLSTPTSTSEATASIPDAIQNTALGTSTSTPWAISKTIPAAFDESLSYLEMLMAILSKQNEIVEKMNSVVAVLTEHEGEISNLYTITAALRADLVAAINEYTIKIKQLRTELNTRIDEEVETLNTRITNEVDTLNARITNEIADVNARITSLYNELVQTIENNYKTLDNKIDTNVAELNSLIANNDAKHLANEATLQSNIDALDVKLVAYIDKQIADIKSAMDSCCDELKSLIESRYNDLLTHSDTRDDELQYNLNAVYNLLMAGALTASEYDALEITADDYDSGAANKINGYQLTAHDYDTNGKYYLTGSNGSSTSSDEIYEFVVEGDAIEYFNSSTFSTRRLQDNEGNYIEVLAAYTSNGNFERTPSYTFDNCCAYMKLPSEYTNTSQQFYSYFSVKIHYIFNLTKNTVQGYLEYDAPNSENTSSEMSKWSFDSAVIYFKKPSNTSDDYILTSKPYSFWTISIEINEDTDFFQFIEENHNLFRNLRINALPIGNRFLFERCSYYISSNLSYSYQNTDLNNAFSFNMELPLPQFDKNIIYSNESFYPDRLYKDVIQQVDIAKNPGGTTALPINYRNYNINGGIMSSLYKFNVQGD